MGKLLLVILIFCGTALAQLAEQVAIERAKNALVSSFDRNLPKVTLEAFLTNATNKGQSVWEVNDCGEQSGDPESDSQRDIPICAQVRITVPNGSKANVMVAVGTSKKGISGRPELFDVSVTRDGLTDAVQLRDLPAELNRTQPK